MSNVMKIRPEGAELSFADRDRQAGSGTDRHDEANNLRTRLKNKTFVLDTKLRVWQKDSVTELAYCCIDFNFVHHFLILGLKDRLNSGPSLLQKSFETQRYMTAFILPYFSIDNACVIYTKKV